MELVDLRIFLAVVRAQGITKAAQELFTVQSNVSARVHALEKELGVSLFRRHARGVVLTNSGEQLRPYAERIIRLADEVSHIMGDESDPSGLLSLGSMETTAGIRLPDMLSTFSEECPKVDLSLVTGTTDELTQAVLEARLDGAFVSGPVLRTELTETSVCIERLVVVTAERIADFTTALPAPSNPKIIVFRDGCSYRRRLEKILTDRGASTIRRMELGTLEGILACVSAGMGLTLLPADVVADHVARGKLRAHNLPDDEGHAQTVFIRRGDTLVSPALARFLVHTHLAPPALSVLAGPVGGGE